MAHVRAGEKAPEEDAVCDRSAYLEKTPKGTAPAPARERRTSQGARTRYPAGNDVQNPLVPAEGETGARTNIDINKKGKLGKKNKIIHQNVVKGGEKTHNNDRILRHLALEFENETVKQIET